MIGKAINLDITVRELFDRNEHDRKQIDWNTLKHIDLNLLEFKNKSHILDFNDMIRHIINKKEKLPNFKAISYTPSPEKFPK